MTIKKRLIILALASVLVIASIGAFNLWNSTLIKDKIRKSRDIDLLVNDVFELNIVTYQYMMYHEKRMQEQWRLKYHSLGNLLHAMGIEDFSSQCRNSLSEVRSDYEDLGLLFDLLQKNLAKRETILKESGPVRMVDMTYAVEERLITQTLMRAQNMVSAAFDVSKNMKTAIIELQEKMNVTIFFSIMGFTVLALWNTFVVVKSIAAPMSLLVKGVQTVGTGNLDYKVGLASKNEIGQFSRAFDQMTDNLKRITASRDDLEEEIEERKKAESSLRKLHAELEQRVRDRTKELQAANEELSQYAYVVSHDLKAPFRAIRNYSDFLREDLEKTLEGDQKEYLDGMNRAVGQGEELINDLLSLSRIDRSEEASEPADIKEVILDLAASLKLDENVELTVIDDMPVIETDRVLLSQVFSNLIENGIKFNTSPVKHIRIGCRDAAEGHFEIFVQDNGIGIEPKFFDNVFQVFQRLHTRQEYEGAGIGLAIVKKAVAKLGGSIRVESEPGKGSTFFIDIPHSKMG